MVLRKNGTIIGVFKDQRHAVKAVRDLRQAGFEKHDLGLVAREWVEGIPPAETIAAQQRAAEGAVVGAATGAGIGAVATLLGNAIVPGLGFVAAGGLLVNALGGAALGAAGGTFIGPFIALEMSREEAERHASDVEKGRTVVIVKATDRDAEARAILLKNGAYDDSMRAAPLDESAAGAAK